MIRFLTWLRSLLISVLNGFARTAVFVVLLVLVLLVIGLAHGDGMPGNMVLALDLGRQLDVPLPTTAVSNEFLTAARGLGWTQYDFACVFDVLASLAGVTTPLTAGEASRRSKMG